MEQMDQQLVLLLFCQTEPEQRPKRGHCRSVPRAWVLEKGPPDLSCCLSSPSHVEMWGFVSFFPQFQVILPLSASQTDKQNKRHCARSSPCSLKSVKPSSFFTLSSSRSKRRRWLKQTALRRQFTLTMSTAIDLAHHCKFIGFEFRSGLGRRMLKGSRTIFLHIIYTTKSRIL